MEQPTILCRHCPFDKLIKNRLDNYWASQELRYYWEAELSGTRSRRRVEFWVFLSYTNNQSPGLVSMLKAGILIYPQN